MYLFTCLHFSGAYDSDAAMKVHISQYDKICMLKVKDLLPSLFSKGVVTLQQKQKIENKEQFEQEGMKVLLDDVILPSLKLNTTEKYKGFLQSMEESDDQTWKEMAKRLGMYLSHKSVIIIYIQYILECH